MSLCVFNNGSKAIRRIAFLKGKYKGIEITNFFLLFDMLPC